MRLLSFVALAACLALPSTVLAQAPTSCAQVHCCYPTQDSFSSVRQDNPEIDDAIAALPSSDFHGTINRLDALFSRGQVRNLGCGDAAQLPSNFQRSFESAIADLAADLDAAAADTSLTDEQFLMLAQVANKYAFRRLLAFYPAEAANPPCTPGGITFCQPGTGPGTEIPCVPIPPPPCTEDPAAFDALDSVLVEIQPRWTAIWNATPGNTSPKFLNINNFNNAVRIETGSTTMLTIKGVESIDD
jgi:hypothetical protein